MPARATQAPYLEMPPHCNSACWDLLKPVYNLQALVFPIDMVEKAVPTPQGHHFEQDDT